MYLHGDGGTRIFHLNALDPQLPDADTDSPEAINEKAELRRLFRPSPFDVVITNPPFAKALDRSERSLRSWLTIPAAADAAISASP